MSSDVISSPLWNFTPLRRETRRCGRRCASSSRRGRGSARAWTCRLRVDQGLEDRLLHPFADIRALAHDLEGGAGRDLLDRDGDRSGDCRVWPMAKRGRARPPAARLAPAMKRRRSTGRMFPPFPLERGLWRSECYSIQSRQASLARMISAKRRYPPAPGWAPSPARASSSQRDVAIRPSNTEA